MERVPFIFRNASEAARVAQASLGAEAAACPMQRVQIPCSAWCAVSLWLGCAVAYAQGRWLSESSLLFGAIGAAALALALALAAVRCGLSVREAILIGALLGCLCGCSGALALAHARESAASEPHASLSLSALEDAACTPYGASARMLAQTPEGRSYVVMAYFDESDADVRYGDAISVSSLIKPVDMEDDWLWTRGVAATVSLPSFQSYAPSGPFAPVLALRNAAIDAILEAPGSSTARGALAALVCGYRTWLSESEVYESFKLSGLAHLIAVSGSHLSLVSGLGALALQFLHAGVRTRSCALGMLVGAYLLIAGCPVSAVRSAVMAVCGISATFVWRRASSLSALSVCVIVMIAVDPACAVSASFALSAASTATICLLVHRFSQAFRCASAPSALRPFIEGTALTLSASVGSQPLSASLFSQLPLLSLPANLAAAPLFTAACIFGLIGALFGAFAPLLAAPLLAVALALVEALCAIAGFFAAAPYACVPAALPLPAAVVLVFGLSALFSLDWRKRRTRIVYAMCVASFVALAGFSAVCAFARADEITAFDVGQGDALLIRSQGVSLLVDTGNQDKMLASALARNGVYRLDGVMISHADDDHCGSLRFLSGIVEIERIYLANDALACPCASCSLLRGDAVRAVGSEGVVGVSAGDALQVGRFAIEVVHPHEFKAEGGNADSVCLSIRSDPNSDGTYEWTALLVGDAEAEQLSAILEADALPSASIDVFKVGHHGSSASITPEIAGVLSPRVTLVSVGDGNRYGHPSDKVIEALLNAGSTVFRTDESGDVSCRFLPDRIEVHETLQ